MICLSQIREYRHKLSVALFIVTLLLTGFSCSNDQEIDPDLVPQRITIENDEELLNSRVTVREDTINVVDNSGNNRVTKGPKFTLILRNEILPPEINGSILQASSVDLDDNLAVVSYNFAGAPSLGAIESYTVNKNAKLKSQILFSDSDIHDVFVMEDRVYLATSSSNTINDSTAIAEVYSLEGFKFSISGYQRFPLGSYVANCVSFFENKLVMTTGDDEMTGGGVYLIDRSNFSILNYIPLHDARWVDVRSDQLFVLQGTPGQYNLYDTQLSLQKQNSVPGADIPESKSTMEVHGNMAFIAAGPAGVQIFDINRDKKIGEIPLPESKSGQITLTNAVSYEDGLLFISNGEGGIWVAEILSPVDSTIDAVELTLLGYLEFDNLPSVNHVDIRNDMLFIAAGLGGLKVVEVVK